MRSKRLSETGLQQGLLHGPATPWIQRKVFDRTPETYDGNETPVILANAIAPLVMIDH
jgi:hypothetical protein